MINETLFSALGRVKAPLADRMRPQSLEEFAGQEVVLAVDSPLRVALDKGHLVSQILWGPPGCGKTTLARLLAQHSRAYFYPLGAVSAGVAEVRKGVQLAQERLRAFGQRTVLFLDEIHRFSRIQQDALLPFVEEGTFILIGATTENPHYCLTAPLMSRCRVLRLQPLSDKAIKIILKRALADKERGLGAWGVTITDKAATIMALFSSGDARSALNLLEYAAIFSIDNEKLINAELVQQVAVKMLPYDSTADCHYDCMSAFIKSLRGCDPDAALYWLARMIRAGEDPLFIARRLVIAAAEDVGNADPQALQITVSAAKALEMIGMPEGKLLLAQAAIYVATAPKSNASYLALTEALADVDNLPLEPVPLSLKNLSIQEGKKSGLTMDYQYPHNYPGNFVKQDYRPPAVSGRSYYKPTDNGFEKQIKDRLQRWWSKWK
ncbi:MAG TPA: replication-associated recombination protein A [bacterium]|nr:replication-associated recombination protein A [bacterium]